MRTEAIVSGTEWVGRTDFLTARPKPSRAGGADANTLLALQENGTRKVDVSRCASMAARFRCRLLQIRPER